MPEEKSIKTYEETQYEGEEMPASEDGESLAPTESMGKMPDSESVCNKIISSTAQATQGQMRQTLDSSNEGDRFSWIKDDGLFNIFEKLIVKECPELNTTIVDASAIKNDDNNEARFQRIREAMRIIYPDYIVQLDAFCDEEMKAIQIICAGNARRLQIFTDLINEEKKDLFHALIAARGVYGNDDEKFNRVMDEIIKVLDNSGELAVQRLVSGAEVYGDNEERFKIFVNLLREKGTSVVEALTAARGVYGNDDEKFNRVKDKIVKVFDNGGEWAVQRLVSGAGIYNDNEERFRVFADLAETNKSAADALVNAKDVYGDNEERFKIFAEMARGKNGSSAVPYLVQAKQVYGDNEERFKIFVNLLREKGTSVVGALTAVRKIYGNDLEKFNQIKNLIIKTFDEKGAFVVDKIIEAKDAIGDNEERFRVFTDLAETNKFAATALVNAKEGYGDNEERFKIFAEMAREKGTTGVEALAAASQVYGNDEEKFNRIKEAIIKAFDEKGADFMRCLCMAKKAYGNSEKKFKSFIESDAFADAVKASNNYALQTVGKFTNADYSAYGALSLHFKIFPEDNFLQEVTPQNALFMLEVYSGVDEERYPGFEQERNAIKEAVEKNKNGVILERLIVIRDIVLKKGPNGLSEAELMSIAKIEEAGLPHFRVLEATVDYIAMLVSSSVEDDFRASVDSVVSKIAKYRFDTDTNRVKRSKKTVDYKDTDLASFYEKSVSISGADPELYQTILDCFNVMELDTGNFKLMQENVMADVSVIASVIALVPSSLGDETKKVIMSRLQQTSSELAAIKNIGNKTAAEKKSEQKTIIEKLDDDCRNILVKMFDQGLHLKNMPEITHENMPDMMAYLKYFANIHEPDEKKKAILALFLALKLTGQWDSFRLGKSIETAQYLGEDIKPEAEKYLKERETLDIFDFTADPGKKAEFMATLEAKTESVSIGESRGILEVVEGIEKGYQDLLDPDNFENEEEKKRWLSKIEEFCKHVEAAKIEQKVKKVENLLIPENKIIGIFKKIGTEMTTESGAMPLQSDVDYLEDILGKNQTKLTDTEMNEARSYISEIKKQVMAIGNLCDDLAKRFRVMVAQGGKVGDRLTKRFKEFEKMFDASASNQEMHLVSTMTGDMVDVIGNIRQCLGCTTKECNNDTNLTFGDSNRFLIIAKVAGTPEGKSISDQLVTMQKTEENGQMSYSFIMDKVYGNRARDVLVSNVLAVIKKLRVLKSKAGDVKLDIFVTNAAFLSCNVSPEYLIQKLKKECGDMAYQPTSKEVTITQSASGDGHYEIGGPFSGRVASGKGLISGLRIE